MEKVRPRWWWLVVVAMVVAMVAMVARRESYDTDTKNVAAMVEKFCDKHYGKDKWSLDTLYAFNEQLSFVAIRTNDGGQTDLSVIPQSRSIIIEGTTSAKTPACRVHRF